MTRGDHGRIGCPLTAPGHVCMVKHYAPVRSVGMPLRTRRPAWFPAQVNQ